MIKFIHLFAVVRFIFCGKRRVDPTFQDIIELLHTFISIEDVQHSSINDTVVAKHIPSLFFPLGLVNHISYFSHLPVQIHEATILKIKCSVQFDGDGEWESPQVA